MAEIFAMPKLGMDMEEGLVANWLKAEGDTVKKGEPIAEIETDKSCVEVESPADGVVLKIFAEAGETMPCGTPIAVIGAAGEPIPDVTAPAAQAPAAPIAEPAAPAAVSTDLFFLMPKLGMDMEEGLVANWLKAEGDTVEKGEPIAEIETDKSVVEVEAPRSGVILKIYCPEGEAAPCGDPIAAIGPAGTQVPADAKAAAVAPAVAPAPAAPAAVDNDLFFLMPKLGMDMEEGLVANWLKAEGDAVEKGEPIAEIETDKSVVEVEAPRSGVILKIYCPEGEAAPCGDPIAAIGPAGTQVPADPKAAMAAPAPAAPAAAPADVPAAPAKVAAAVKTGVAAKTPGGRIRVSPRACRLAAQNGVDVSSILGTGEDGRIVEQDVANYIASGASAAQASVRRVPTETVEPISMVRKVTARRMMQSLSESAQTNHRVDVDTTNMMNFRKQVNAKLEKDGIKVSVVDILAMACARALIENPMANAYMMSDGLHMHNYANVGIACDTPKGLMVPVVKDADVLSITEMAQASRKLINKARNGELKPDDMSGGTFTISNLGMFEIDSFTAVLNPPETCILAVSRTQDKVVVENGQMVIRPMMNLCLTYDHRVLDGAPAARFLETIKHYIENPVWLVV